MSVLYRFCCTHQYVCIDLKDQLDYEDKGSSNFSTKKMIFENSQGRARFLSLPFFILHRLSPFRKFHPWGKILIISRFFSTLLWALISLLNEQKEHQTSTIVVIQWVITIHCQENVRNLFLVNVVTWNV